MRDGSAVVYFYVLLICCMLFYIVDRHLEQVAKLEDTIQLQQKAILKLHEENESFRSFFESFKSLEYNDASPLHRTPI